MLDTTNLLWYSSIAVEFLFCLHLLWTQIAKNYPIFTGCLGFSVARSLAALYFMRGAAGARLPLTYTYFWLWNEPFWLLIQAAVVWEVHTKMWRNHREVLRKTRPLLLFALLTAIMAAAVPIRAEAIYAQSSRLLLVMHFTIQATRYISSVLAIFLVLSAVLFFVAVGNDRASSVLRHDALMAAYFAIYAIAAFLIDTGWAIADFVNGYFVAAITLCWLAWFSVFKSTPLTNE
jgi:hypothetical protein